MGILRYYKESVRRIHPWCPNQTLLLVPKLKSYFGVESKILYVGGPLTKVRTMKEFTCYVIDYKKRRITSKMECELPFDENFRYSILNKRFKFGLVIDSNLQNHDEIIEKISNILYDELVPKENFVKRFFKKVLKR